ncbi:MAG: DUF4292 domain-containing protein [Bacteroidales bacterium]|nr:DUF4292 domain-containing protein [Bacteroidales bacterium]
MSKLISTLPLRHLNKLFLLLIIPFVFSCKTERSIIKKPIKKEGADYLIENLKKNEFAFKSLSAKFTASFVNNNKKNSIRGQIRIKKDSVIWMSISPMLGIEMARVKITPDSIKFINRLESTYLETDFNYVNKFINSALDFDMLQAFLLGNDFSFYERSRFKASIDSKEYRLTTIERRKLKKYIDRNDPEVTIPLQKIWLNPDNFKITQVMIKELVDEKRKFEASYTSFEKLEEQLFPKSVKFEIESVDKEIEVGIDYSRVIINQTDRFPFGIPDRYQEIPRI